MNKVPKKKQNITKGQKRLVITVNEIEFDHFTNHKIKEGKSGQLLCYRALERAGLFTPITEIKESL